MTLSDLLEKFEDGQNVLVSFENGDEFVLFDFEIVDESIYDRSDLALATISDVNCSKSRYTKGTKLEFALGDICELNDPVKRTCYFRKLN